MPGQSLMMFLSVVAIAIASNRADEAHNVASPAARGPASVSGKKELETFHRDILKHTHKARGPLAVAVELVGAKPQQPGDVFVLKGVISAESSLDNVEFSWRVPAGVEIVNGQTTSVISGLNEGKPYESQITLRQVGPENVRVTLRVRGRDEGMRFGDSAVYHSLDQDRLESARAELRKVNEAYMKSGEGKKGLEAQSTGKKQLKIFH